MANGKLIINFTVHGIGDKKNFCQFHLRSHNYSLSNNFFIFIFEHVNFLFSSFTSVSCTISFHKFFFFFRHLIYKPRQNSVPIFYGHNSSSYVESFYIQDFSCGWQAIFDLVLTFYIFSKNSSFFTLLIFFWG